MTGVKNFKEWRKKCASRGDDSALVPELNIRPAFKAAGSSALTSAAQLKTFNSYQLLRNAALKKEPIYAGPYGIINIKL